MQKEDPYYILIKHLEDNWNNKDEVLRDIEFFEYLYYQEYSIAIISTMLKWHDDNEIFNTSLRALRNSIPEQMISVLYILDYFNIELNQEQYKELNSYANMNYIFPIDDYTNEEFLAKKLQSANTKKHDLIEILNRVFNDKINRISLPILMILTKSNDPDVFKAAYDALIATNIEYEFFLKAIFEFNNSAINKLIQQKSQ